MVLITAVFVLVGAVIVGGAVILNQKPGGAPATSENPFGLIQPGSATPTDLADGKTLGKADAPVTMEVYEDYQCPICGELVTTVEPKVIDAFVETGQVRIVSHDVAFLDRGTSESVDAWAAAACAADQGKYWAFHDWIYANQSGENEGGFRVERLRAIAEAAGLDMTRYDSCMATGQKQAQAATVTNAAVAQGFTQTPTLVINGVKNVGLPSYETLATYLRSVIASAAPSAGGSASPSAVSSPSPSASSP